MRIAVIGCGYWGKHFVRICLQSPLINDVKIFDKSIDALNETKTLYPNVLIYDNLDQLLNDRLLDAAIVATELTNHFIVASSLLENGKHVLCEKPLAQTEQATFT